MSRRIPKGPLPAAICLVLVLLSGIAARGFYSGLAALAARWDCGWDVIVVSWQTVDETDTIGFHVWRSRSRDGVYYRVTEELEEAAGGWGGARYFFEDNDVSRYQAYYYQVEERRYGGIQVFHGPVRASDDCGDFDDDDDNRFVATCFIDTLTETLGVKP